MPPPDPAEILLSSFRLHGALDTADEVAVRGLKYRVGRFNRGETAVRGGAKPSESCFVLGGLATREMILPRGARQFVGIYIRGDFIDLHAYLLDWLDHDVLALTDATMAFVSHKDISELLIRPTINRLLWRFVAIDAAIQRCWLASMARRPAAQRLAHFLCEQFARMHALGMAADRSFQLPISQVILGDVIGLSPVHMNRSIQSLRRSGLVTWEGSTVTIPDNRLREMCGFEPSYLNLNRPGLQRV